MRGEIVIVAAALALTGLPATSAHAQQWCGYAAQPKSIIECGYSTAEQCENTIGKGGMCFINPNSALNTGRPPRREAKKPVGRG